MKTASKDGGQRWLGLGLGLAALACGAGPDDAGSPSVPVTPIVQPAPTSAGAPCDSPAGDCAQPDAVEAPTSGPRGVDDETRVDTAEAHALARARVESILESNCGACHGHVLTVEDASGGINYIDELELLTDNGLVAPLSSADSRVIQVIRSGEMPPPGSGPPPVSDEEIDFIAGYIDDPRYWTTLQPPCNDQRLDADAVYAMIAADLARLGPDAAPSTRYISFADEVNAGLCVRGRAFERARRTLFKLLNMVSTAPEIKLPAPVDATETVYRINLADYGWGQPVTVGDASEATEHGDKWEAIVAHDPYATPFVGADADAAARLSGSPVPILLASSMLHTAMTGDLYYALIGVDVQAPLAAFIRDELQIDVAENLQEQRQVRAVTTRSRFFPEARLLQRDALGARPGVLWQLFRLDEAGIESATRDPFQLVTGRTDAIFTLPNGALAYLLADERGQIVDSVGVRLEGEPDTGTLQVASCSYCHAGGLIPVVDELRDSVLQGTAGVELGGVALERLDATYPNAAALAQLVQADNAASHERMSSAVQLDTVSIDPVASAYVNFEGTLTLASAAGALGLTAAQLDALLPELPPALGALATGGLDRDSFNGLYRTTLCQLPRAGNNRPAPSVCQPAAP
jgi:hypothetical protein